MPLVSIIALGGMLFNHWKFLVSSIQRPVGHQRLEITTGIGRVTSKMGFILACVIQAVKSVPKHLPSEFRYPGQ